MTKLFVFIQSLVANFRSEERGATAVEYGLILTLISLMIIAAATIVGTDLAAIFQRAANAL